MTEIEAKIRCLELAAALGKPQNIYDAESIVKLASMLYDFIEAPPLGDSPVEIADKPKRGRPAKQVDILS